MEILMLFFLLACSDVEEHDHHNHENEMMTTINLTFTSDGGNNTFTWADVEQSGTPSIDDISLAADTVYTLTLEILNELEEPAEDITEEILDEADEHQVFFTGTDVGVLYTQTYNDEDGNGIPLGLENTISTLGAGEGGFSLVLRHMPAENGNPTKVEGLAEQVDEEGFTNVGGNNDFDITFPLIVE
jgi:hypothetical protein